MRYTIVAYTCISSIRVARPHVYVLSIFLLSVNYYFRYSLYAVVNHSGSLHNGHYTCYIRPQQDQVLIGVVVVMISATRIHSQKYRACIGLLPESGRYNVIIPG